MCWEARRTHFSPNSKRQAHRMKWPPVPWGPAFLCVQSTSVRWEAAQSALAGKYTKHRKYLCVSFRIWRLWGPISWCCPHYPLTAGEYKIYLTVEITLSVKLLFNYCNMQWKIYTFKVTFIYDYMTFFSSFSQHAFIIPLSYMSFISWSIHMYMYFLYVYTTPLHRSWSCHQL